MLFLSTPEAITWLESQTKSKPKTNLDKMAYAMDHFKIRMLETTKFHVGGTNGKGSVVKFITSVMYEAGFNVGSFMSPYVHHFNERILINNEPIDDASLLKLINQMYRFNDAYQSNHDEGYSFFELLTIMAFLHFQDLALDVIVIEVGIGGLLDSTNILHYDASIITSVGMDHMKILGDTIEEIAYNKIGILKESGTCFTSIADKNVIDIFHARAKDMKANLYNYFYEGSWEHMSVQEDSQSFTHNQAVYEIKLLGEHMVRNAILAIEAIHHLMPFIPDDIIFEGLRNVTYHGRFETLDFTKTKTIIDAAHNTQAMEALAHTVRHLYGGKRIHLVLSVLGDKKIREMIEIIGPVVDQIYLSGFPDPRYVSLAPHQTTEMPYYEDVIEAYMAADMDEPDLILVTGSIHFIGYFVKRLKLN